MHRITKHTYEENVQKLCQAIRKKSRYGITPHQLRRITSRINVNRPYLIKTTAKPQKFLNMVTEEFISTGERSTISYIIPLYGNYKNGFFCKTSSKTYSEASKLLSHHSAAALKMTIQQAKGIPLQTTYTIIVYENPLLP